MKIDTSLIHQVDPLSKTTKEIIEPLHTSTIFAMNEPSSNNGFQYGRVGNPTRLVLEQNLSKYAQAKYSLSFSSGSAAITALLMTLSSKDEVICHDEVYEGTQRILQKHFLKLNIVTHFIDCGNKNKLKKLLQLHQKTKLIIIESPTNPLLQVLNIKQISKIAHKQNVSLAVDNTFATSLLQQPLHLGADIVVESLSKHINGQSNVIGGMIATNKKRLLIEIKEVSDTLGLALSPRDADQVLRGLKTMKLRVDKQCDNAETVVSFLKKHSCVSRVLFPYDEIASEQMSKSGSIISFNIKKKPFVFLQNLKLVKIAHSFGGIETLIQQPTTMMDLSFTKSQLKNFKINNNFFRLSIGIEDVEDIISDLQQAFLHIEE